LEIESLRQHVKSVNQLTDAELNYYFVQDTTSNSTYNAGIENIRIAFKSGEMKEISEVENTLIGAGLLVAIKKAYICFLRN